MADAKKLLRTQSRRTRAAISKDVAKSAAKVLAFHVVADIPIEDGVVVAGYWPFPDELDPRPLMRVLETRGHTLCLPVVIDRAAPLLFRTWSEGQPLIESVYGTKVPPPEHKTVTPDVLLVPLLAFDAAGYRLGYGGGFYDRTLARLTETGAVSIGLGFAAQEVAHVPHDEHDWRLDWLATENGVKRVA